MGYEERKKLRQEINAVTTSPWERFKYNCMKFIATVGTILILLWMLTHADEIVDWWYGK